MIVVNVGWNRKVRRKGRRVIEHRNVSGIKLPFCWDNQNAIRWALMARRPGGNGWNLTGYTLVSP